MQRKQNVTPEDMRKEVDKQIDHVRSHDPATMQFALMCFGHENPDQTTHVCTLAAGPPELLTRAITGLIEEMTKADPAFAIHFLLNMMRTISTRRNLSQLDETGGEKAAAKLKELLAQFQKPENGKPH